MNASNIRGFAPLMVAAQKGDLKVMNALIRKGANLDAQTNDGVTALMSTAFNGHIAATRMLIAGGANRDIKSKDGDTALSIASRKNHTAIVNMLSRKTSKKPAANPPRSTSANTSTRCAKSRTKTASFYLNGKIQTGLKVNRGDRLTFTAKGKVSFGSFAGSGGPDGINGFRSYNLIRNADLKHGVLLARIKQRGNNNSWYKIGSNGQIVSRITGTLELAVNDIDPSNNGGEFDVQVAVCKAR